MAITFRIPLESFFKIVFLVFAMSLFVQSTWAYDFSEWDSLLEKYVSPKTISGVRLNAVDYKNIKSDPAYQKLLANLEKIKLLDIKSKQEKLAFWINVYNIMAVKLVLDHFPVNSIKDTGNLFRSAWKKKIGVVGGKVRTLNEIEHEILRKMNEPRIHVAIVCASVSCPDLRKEAYHSNRMEAQLNDQMKTFLANPDKGLRIENGKLYLSSIFKWFKKDFESHGGVLPFIRSYLDGKEGKVIDSVQSDINYMDYYWELNIR